MENQDLNPIAILIYASVFVSLLSLAEMNEMIRFLIYLLTLVGVIIKTYQTYHESGTFKDHLKRLIEWTRQKLKI